jgi:hypothetical protein
MGKKMVGVKSGKKMAGNGIGTKIINVWHGKKDD